VEIGLQLRSGRLSARALSRRYFAGGGAPGVCGRRRRDKFGGGGDVA